MVDQSPHFGMTSFDSVTDLNEPLYLLIVNFDGGGYINYCFGVESDLLMLTPFLLQSDP